MRRERERGFGQTIRVMFENDVSSRDAAVFKAHYPDIFSEIFLQPNLKGKFLNKIPFVLENLYSLSIVLLILAREPFFHEKKVFL